LLTGHIPAICSAVSTATVASRGGHHQHKPKCYLFVLRCVLARLIHTSLFDLLLRKTRMDRLPTLLSKLATTGTSQQALRFLFGQ
jgi:hypothetical protein